MVGVHQYMVVVIALVVVCTALGAIIVGIIGLILRNLIGLFNRYEDWSIARKCDRAQRRRSAR